MDASLKGLGAILLQEDNEGNLHVVSYASYTLKPYEKSMKSYSSAKLKLLALKWSVCKKFRDYLIGFKFTVLMDKVRCFSNLLAQQSYIVNFDIRYCAGKSNQMADALSQQPENPNSASESSDEEEEWETFL